MNTAIMLETLENLDDAIATLTGKAKAVRSIIEVAKKEKRDVTQKEIDSIIIEDDVIRIALNDAILRHRG
jgi:hypothetical protein